MAEPTASAVRIQRLRLLVRLNKSLERPMVVLAFVWLGLFITDALGFSNPFLNRLGWLIWGLFWLEFLAGLLVAPSKSTYLKHNWLKLIALVAPALRIYRVASLLRFARFSRAAGASRGLRLVRLVSSLNRGMAALGRSIGRRRLGYVLLLTLVMTFVGAAGMYAFESASGMGIDSYGTAVWWTAMIMTTMGSEAWPKTAEGRLLCLLLATYAFAVFGYVTAAFASFFVGRDADDPKTGVASSADVRALREELQALRAELRGRPVSPGSPPSPYASLD